MEPFLQVTSPKLATTAQQNCQIQLGGNSAWSDVTSNRRGILPYRVAGERPDPNTSFGAAGQENVLLSIEVNELSRTNRITQTEVSVMEQNTRLALFLQNQQFQFVV